MLVGEFELNLNNIFNSMQVLSASLILKLEKCTICEKNLKTNT